MPLLLPFTDHEVNTLLSPRSGEQKLGQTLSTFPCAFDDIASYVAALEQAKAQGIRFVIIGIGEDIGPRANLGRGGANDAFNASMAQFVNLQANRFLDGSQILIAGQLDTSAIHVGSDLNTDALRNAVEQLDELVIQALSPIFSAGLEPIVIGGGHNNAFGLLTAAKQATAKKVAAVNLDPHSDFRPREGRHSGNGFSYAAASGALGFYHVLGLHELKNSEQTFAQLEAFGGSWHSLQSIWVRQELSLNQALDEIVGMVKDSQLPVAIELDLDAITNMPSSAATAAGIPLLDALRYVYRLANETGAHYLHLAEGAPQCHAAGVDAGYREVGQSVSELIFAYIQGRNACQYLG
ncbi:formimidoylglutamase [Shewanella sp. Scap07]|uniref:formimidoylglutamase n=1 Tax=Shewanella sp. Scap07 TaxID=2589987 RepID=UPI0015BC4467|nr:formimidoylglutamase [Shewanella sp. Scap07]QLE84073.1 formimidoylglutamase [Shewanella sp. Scap07]